VKVARPVPKRRRGRRLPRRPYLHVGTEVAQWKQGFVHGGSKSDIIRNLNIHGDIKLQEDEPTPEELEKMRAEAEELEKMRAEALTKSRSILHLYNLLRLHGPASLDLNTIEEKAAIEAIQQADPTNFQQIASTTIELSNSYYTSVRMQSAESFKWSRIISGVGFFFFLAAIIFLIFELGNVSYLGATISAVGGVLVEVYAGLIQWQGKQTVDQAKDYHIRLDRIQRFIIANSACESLNDSEKQQTRSEIIRKLVE
jgi:hypothetical protein